MEIPLNLKTLSNPLARLLLGIVLIIIGTLCFVGQNWYSGITRENCKEVETSLDKVLATRINDTSSHKIELFFEDYDQSLVVHSSCSSVELMSDLLDLEKGTKMTVIHSNKNSNIYELRVNGEVWLDFDTTKAKIDENIAFLKYVGYVLIPIGAILIISAAVSAVVKKRKA